MTYQERSCPGPPTRQTQTSKSNVMEAQKYSCVCVSVRDCVCVCVCVCVYLDNVLWTFLHCLQSVEDEALIGRNHRLRSLQRLHFHFYPKESDQQCRLATGPLGHTGMCGYVYVSVCFCGVCLVLYTYGY